MNPVGKSKYVRNLARSMLSPGLGLRHCLLSSPGPSSWSGSPAPPPPQALPLLSALLGAGAHGPHQPVRRRHQKQESGRLKSETRLSLSRLCGPG